MLKVFRKKNVAKTVLWGLAILIIPAFVLWGAGSVWEAKRAGSNYAGIFNGRKVSLKELFENIAGVRCQLILNYWNQQELLNRLLDNKPFLARLAWDRLIMLSAARSKQIKVYDEEVVNYIRFHPLFTRGGAFDNKIYEYLLKQTFGLTPREFEETIRENLTITKLRNLITKDVKVSDGEVFEEYRRLNEKVRIGYIFVDAEDFMDRAEAPEKDIKDYHDAHRREFVVDEQAEVAYVAFKYSDYKNEMEAIKAAKDFASKVSEGAGDLEGAAKASGLIVENTGLFSWGVPIPKIGAVKELQTASFALEAGETSDVIIPSDPSVGRCFVIKVKSKAPRHEATFAEARGDIAAFLKTGKAFELCSLRAAELEREIQALLEKGTETLETACAKLNLNYRESSLFSRYDIDEELGETATIWDESFKAKEGAVIGPTKAATGYLIFTPIEFVRLKEGSFEKEKGEFAKKVLERRRNQEFDRWASGTASNATLTIDPAKIEKYYR